MYDYLIHSKVMFSSDLLLDFYKCYKPPVLSNLARKDRACMACSRLAGENCSVEVKPAGPTHRPAA